MKEPLAKDQKRKIVGGVSLTGGQNEIFYLAILEYFPAMERWFLTKLSTCKDENTDSDKLLKSLIEDGNFSIMVSDFPLTLPQCEGCKLLCPGETNCIDPHIRDARKVISELLGGDRKRSQQHPKKYERDRNQNDLIDYSQKAWSKESGDYILSRNFKRRLKKGITAYWNRPLDLWVWINYYDPMISILNFVYDSFGANSLIKLFRFHYWQKSLFKNHGWVEGSASIVLLELLRAKIITQKALKNLNIYQHGSDARAQILEMIEQHLQIFIYQHDLEVMIQRPKAFNSFLLGVVGQRELLGMRVSPHLFPGWTLASSARLIFPQF